MDVTKRRTRWRQVVFAVLIFFVALELVLQLGALVAPLVTPSRATGDGAAVLCVGDSYTFGIGATSPAASYPQQLEARLRERGHDVGVSNGGSPAKDSAFVLRRLPALLRPGTRVLCVLLGTNDAWSRPALVPEAEVTFASGDDGDGFVLRWRTGRLLALLFRGGATTGGAVPVAAADEHVRADLVDQGAGFALLQANDVIPKAPRVPVLAPPCPEALRAGVDEVGRFVQRHEASRARDVARRLAAANPDSPHVLRALVAAAHAAGDRALLDDALARLAELAKTGEAAAVESFLLAAHDAGFLEQACAAARAYVEREPAAVIGWYVLQHGAFMLGDWDLFERAAATGLALAGRASPAESAWVVRNYARVLAPRDARKAALLVAAGTLLDGDVALTRAALRAIAAPLPWAEVDPVLVATPVRPEALAALRTLVAPPPAGDAEGWTRVLHEHLMRIGRFAQARGAQVVMLSYPFARPELDAVQRAVAAELGAPFVDVRGHFDELLRTRTREELFVRDGHCNDAGYAVVAELATAAIVPLLAK